MKTSRQGLLQRAARVLLVGIVAFVAGMLSESRIRPWLAQAKRMMNVEPPSRISVRSSSPALDLRRLQALGYVDGTVDPSIEGSGVLRYERDAAYPGYNLYASKKEHGARILDMDGEVVHEWSHGEDSWEHVELLAGGEILVLVNDKRLFKLDRDSNLLWTLEGRFHHDLWVRPNGEIYVLFRRAVRVTAIHDELDVFEDQVLILGPDGAQRDAISLLDVLQESQFAFLLPSVRPTWDGAEDGGALDLLHANHVEVMDGRLQHLNPLFAAGNLLISVRNINAILILDGRSRDVLWLWGPTNLTFQHHPTLLENGNILVFDNGIERSRVLEVELRSRRIVWQYEADHFFSAKRGSNQRLPNGNTLITESDAGYVFEVTRSGEIVWEFANPNISDTEERRAIWRMTRLPASSLDFRPE